MKPIEVRPLTDEELTALDDYYHLTKVVRIRTRVQMILLAAEEQMTAPQIAKIVRRDEQTIRRRVKHFNQEGINGLYNEVEAVIRSAAGRLVLMYLTAFSPWLNPIEML